MYSYSDDDDDTQQDMFNSDDEKEDGEEEADIKWRMERYEREKFIKEQEVRLLSQQLIAFHRVFWK